MDNRENVENQEPTTSGSGDPEIDARLEELKRQLQLIGVVKQTARKSMALPRTVSFRRQMETPPSSPSSPAVTSTSDESLNNSKCLDGLTLDSGSEAEPKVTEESEHDCN